MLRPAYAILVAIAAAVTAFATNAPTAHAQAPCYNCSHYANCNCNCNGNCGHGGHMKYGCCLCDAGCCGCDMGYMKPVRRAEWYNWNRNYANTEYGAPVALVVPPTANMQTNWGWGVASSRVSRIDHQFQRNYPGDGQFGGPYRSTPLWPSDTTQFGVYYVRGPW